MVGPVIDVSPKTSSRYQLPDFSPIAQSGMFVGQNISQGLGKLGEGIQKRRKQRKLSELGTVFRDTGQQGAMDWLFQNPDMASDKAAMTLFQLMQPNEPDKTSLMQNYEYAVGQGYKGSLLDYQNATKSGGTTVNVGGGQQFFDEAQHNVNNYMDHLKKAEEARAAGDLEGAKRYGLLAEAYKDKGGFGDEAGEAANQASRALGTAQDSLMALHHNISTNGMGIPHLSTQSRENSQLYNDLLGALILIEARGANFSANEEKIIKGVLGESPDDLSQRARQFMTGVFEGKSGTDVYLEQLEQFAWILQNKARELGKTGSGEMVDESRLASARERWASDKGQEPTPAPAEIPGPGMFGASAGQLPDLSALESMPHDQRVSILSDPNTPEAYKNQMREALLSQYGDKLDAGQKQRVEEDLSLVDKILLGIKREGGQAMDMIRGFF